MYEMKNLTNVEMSSYSNSYGACYSQQTDSFNCAGKRACQGYNIGVNTSICCQGYHSCRYADIVSAFDDDYDGVIRCDGLAACGDISDFIYNKNGGDIYFGGSSFYGDDFEGGGIIKTKKDSNIYCTSEDSCVGMIIETCNNLYCNGYESCKEVQLISNVNNIWFYGDTSGYGSTIENISENIYCGAREACSGTEITNVGDSIYASGYQVLYGTVISNITNNVVAAGYQAAENANIKNITNVWLNYIVSCTHICIFKLLYCTCVGTLGWFFLFLFCVVLCFAQFGSAVVNRATAKFTCLGFVFFFFLIVVLFCARTCFFCVFLVFFLFMTGHILAGM